MHAPIMTSVIIPLTQSKIAVADDLAWQVDPIGHWSRQAWTEDTYCYGFATDEEANLFRWFCFDCGFWSVRLGTTSRSRARAAGAAPSGRRRRAGPKMKGRGNPRRWD
jgi:hypothetical protein